MTAKDYARIKLVPQKDGSRAAVVDFKGSSRSRYVRRNFYIFQDIDNFPREHFYALKKFIGRHHVGNRLEPAFLCHAGHRCCDWCLGNEPEDCRCKEKGLDRFFDTLPVKCGWYGSFWRETQELLKKCHCFRPFSAARIFYYSQDPSKPPLEWNQKEFENMLVEHQKLQVPPDPFEMVYIVPAIGRIPFFNGVKHAKSIKADFVTIKFDDFIIEYDKKMQGGSEESGKCQLIAKFFFEDFANPPEIVDLEQGWTRKSLADVIHISSPLYERCDQVKLENNVICKIKKTEGTVKHVKISVAYQ